MTFPFGRANTSVFIDPSYIWVRYDDAFDNSGFNRDSQGYDVREMPKTFASFAPLGLVLTIMMGAAVAERSGMSRHRYMILILERAISANVTVREEVAFSNEHP